MTPEQYAKTQEEIDAYALRAGLDVIARLSRHGLLVALDWERDKRNTSRLRKLVRLRWIAGEIHQLDLDNARKNEALNTAMRSARRAMR